MYMKAKTT